MTNPILDWLPVGISIAALTVATISLIFTVSARPKPLLEAPDRVGVAGDIQGDVVAIHNVGRRSMTVRNVGLVLSDGRIVFDAAPTESLAKNNPTLPTTIDPGRVATFFMPIDLDSDPDRQGWEYRVEWLKGRTRGGEARISKLHITRPRMLDLTYPA